MKLVDTNQRFVVSLFVADLFVVLLFVALGMTAHQTWNGPLSLLPASYPFLLAWALWGVILGTFHAGAVKDVRTAARRTLLTWVLALPTAMLVRMWMVGRTLHWSFWAVAFTLGGSMLVVWRVAWAWAAGRHRSNA